MDSNIGKFQEKMKELLAFARKKKNAPPTAPKTAWLLGFRAFLGVTEMTNKTATCHKCR